MKPLIERLARELANTQDAHWSDVNDLKAERDQYKAKTESLDKALIEIIKRGYGAGATVGELKIIAIKAREKAREL